MKGEKIYEYDLDVTGMTDYGVSLDAILSGKEKIPPQGVRIDVAFEGRAIGRLAGQVRGIDYLRMRADGRIDLDIRAVIETGNSCRIALSADGVAVPRSAEPIADLLENGDRTPRSLIQPRNTSRRRQAVAVGGGANVGGHLRAGFSAM